jgi:hypothetical protein
MAAGSNALLGVGDAQIGGFHVKNTEWDIRVLT